jgi:hypothetical protein
VHYRTAGEEGLALLLYHESPLSSIIYESALTYFSSSVRAFAFDTPDYGESAPPPGETEISEYATTLLEAAVLSPGCRRWLGANPSKDRELVRPSRPTDSPMLGWSEEVAL